jgi:hypothetical protein
MAAETHPTTAAPPLASATFVLTAKPTAPADCSEAIKPPAATFPTADIIPAAVEPATTPVAPKPKAPITSGAAITVAAAPTTAPPVASNTVSIMPVFASEQPWLSG